MKNNIKESLYNNIKNLKHGFKLELSKKDIVLLSTDSKLLNACGEKDIVFATDKKQITGYSNFSGNTFDKFDSVYISPDGKIVLGTEYNETGRVYTKQAYAKIR